MSIARPWQVLEPLLGQRELGNIWPEANKHLQNSAPWLKCSLKRKCIKLEIQPEALGERQRSNIPVFTRGQPPNSCLL